LPAPRWEHTFVICHSSAGDTRQIDKVLADHSAAGWELVSHAHVPLTARVHMISFAFKRPVPTDQQRHTWR
jgi:hypothetical protein